MISKKPLIDAHVHSWDELKKLLYIGNTPYINFSKKPVEIPESLLPTYSPSSRKIDYEMIIVYYPSTVQSDGIIVVRPLEEYSRSGLVFDRPPLEVFYYLPGTSVPPKAREKYDEKKLVEDIIRANVENCFREVNPKFYSFCEYFRTYFFDAISPAKHKTGKILGKVLEPYVDGFEINMVNILSKYVKRVSDYFLSRLRPEFVAKKDVLMETLEYWGKQRGLKCLMEEPWEIIGHAMHKQMATMAEDKIFDMEEVYNIFSKYLYTVLKLEINGKWKRLL